MEALQSNEFNTEAKFKFPTMIAHHYFSSSTLTRLVAAIAAILFSSCGPSAVQIAEQKAHVDREKIEAAKMTESEISQALKVPKLSSEQIEEQIKNNYRDPESVRIKNLKCIGFVTQITDPSDTVAYSVLHGGCMSTCGYVWSADVNAKNGYGAYVGYKTEYFYDSKGRKSNTVPFSAMTVFHEFVPRMGKVQMHNR